MTTVAGQATSGRLQLLTYNVAGLPEWLSPSLPSRNQPLASPLFRNYDLVLTQEDWAYHELLVQEVDHPFIATPSERESSFLGDGLGLFSRYPMSGTRHIAWTHCNGYLSALSDCLADKGFAVTTIWLGPFASIDLINLHADAGQSPEDAQAREQEFEQLRDFIETQEQGRALIVAGDTNLDPRSSRDMRTNERFLLQTGLQDACRALRCGSDGIDRILFRSSYPLELSAEAHYRDKRFVDSEGRALSDHPALAVNLRWQLNSATSTLARQR